MHPALDLRPGVARHVADALPALVEGAERGTGRLQVRDRNELLGLVGQLLLELQVLGLLGVTLREHLAAGREEHVLRTAETVPQVVLGLALRPARRLPVRHQLAVAGGRRTPVGRLRQRLGLRDQPLLDLAGVLALRVQRGEVRLAALGEGGTGVREPVPQLVVRLAVQARQTLPDVHQGAQALAGAAPLVALRQLLGLGDQRVLGRPGLVRLLGLGDLALLAPGLHGLDQLVQPHAQGVQVAHGVVLVDLRTQVVDRRLGVLGGQISGPHPLFEEADLDHQALVLALEVGQGLLRGARLPRTDDLLAIGSTHVHGARLVDSAPRVAAHSASST
ncbi:hypothetical protein GCM10010215_45030 [Streptomyces virginiae]|nr:hypothetical protein GCM10010215_45030 [Streptomyces virginiae]